jgi:hypothetical protein
VEDSCSGLSGEASFAIVPYGVGDTHPGTAIIVNRQEGAFRPTPGVEEPGEGVASSGRWGPVEVVWDAQGHLRCLGPVAPATAWVTGRVHDPFGTAGPFDLVGCSGAARTDTSGSFRFAVRPGATCQIWARHAGPSRQWGCGAWVATGTGDTTVWVSTTLDSIRSSLHADVTWSSTGLEVVWREAGSPFWPGDRVVSLDGQPLVHAVYATWARQMATTNEHVLVIVREGEERSVSMSKSTASE